MTERTLCRNIERLRRLIRAGDFSRAGLLKQCWEDRQKLPKGELYSLRLRTIAWEIHYSRGEFVAATECLRDNGEIETGAEHIFQQGRQSDRFIGQYFPPKLPGKVRKARYDLWRQRVMGALAMAADDFLLDDKRRDEMFDATQKFLEECLVKAGFPSFCIDRADDRM